jgi:hypothetical protein
MCLRGRAISAVCYISDSRPRRSRAREATRRLVGVLGGHARVAREPIRKTSCVERLPSQISPWSILKGVQRRRELSAFVDYSMHLQRIGEEGSRKKARS